ncbi:hypothetical protein M3J09_010144 [Ascochyta lentis]
MSSFQHGRVLHFSTFTFPATTIPTTTYSFTYTTASGVESPLPFSTPSVSAPYAPFAARQECCNRWSQYQDPTSQNASCAISNAACDNPYAFWDLHACCNGAEVREAGTGGSDEFNGCQATCDAVGQSWQDLMECLEKRTKAVVCKPDDSEIERTSTYRASVSKATTTTSRTTVASTAECWMTGSNGLLSPTCVPTLINYTTNDNQKYPGAASKVDVRWIRCSKTGIAIFMVVSLGSIAGMLL